MFTACCRRTQLTLVDSAQRCQVWYPHFQFLPGGFKRALKNSYLTDMCSGSKEGSYVIKKKKNFKRGGVRVQRRPGVRLRRRSGRQGAWRCSAPRRQARTVRPPLAVPLPLTGPWVSMASLPGAEVEGLVTCCGRRTRRDAWCARGDGGRHASGLNPEI